MARWLRTPCWRGAAWLGVLGPFFILVYGYANSWSARQLDVPSFVFAWEHDAIPFLPWLMLPYMSIDVFYAGSLFLLRDLKQLDTHARRLLLATLVAVGCFFLFPLQCTLVRPPVDGFNGQLLRMLTSFDKPFNQAPSLHIALLIVLWPVYAGRLRGAVRLALHGWFILIGISVLCTWQHRVIDVIGGIVVGVLVWYALPMPPCGFSWRPCASARKAWLHGAGATTLAALAISYGGLMWWLLWPALSLTMLAIAYRGAGASVFQKDAGGQLSLPAAMVFLPYRWSARLVRGLYRSPGVTGVIEELTLSAWPGPACAGAAVLDVCGEYSRRRTFAAYRSVPMLDFSAPTPADLHAAVSAVETLLARGPVWVHCAMGRGRSAVVAAAWLLYSERADDAGAAMEMVQQRCIGVVFPAGTAGALERWFDDGRYGGAGTQRCRHGFACRMDPNLAHAMRAVPAESSDRAPASDSKVM